MRTLRLARIAAEAEGLRLRRQAQRTATRIVSGLIGLVFFAGALVFLHIAAWFWLRIGAGWAPTWTALTVAGGDVVIGAFFVLAMARSSPGRVEMEALEVRQRAVANARSGFALTAVLVPALRLAVNLLRHRRD